MGRRKERRLAAMSNAGRRVKLDLFEEISGDPDGNSAMEKVGGESDSKSQPELPNTGKKQQNPLSLLEQYSDDEMDEGSNEGSNLASVEDASVEVDEKKIAIFEETEEVQDHVDEPTIQEKEDIPKDGGVSSFDSLQKLEMGNSSEIDCEHTKRPDSEINGTPLLHPSNDEQFNGAVVSGWKMVLHEESNQYYYWNTATGETSWDVPDAFALETDKTSVEKDTDDSDGKTDAGMITYEKRMPSVTEQEMKLNGSCDEIQGGSNDNKELHIGRSPSYETSLTGKYSEENISGIDLSSELKEFSESLLMRLKNLKGWNSNEDEDLKSKYVLETEIRLGDIKALSSHGSSLLPFWQHLEVQLKRLETDVDILAGRQNFSSISGTALESIVGIDNNIERVSGEKKESSAGENLAEPSKPNLQSLDADGVNIVNLPPLGSKSDGNEIGKETEEISQPDFHCEGTDMDVDMEIEDTNPVASTTELHVSTEMSNPNNALATKESTVYIGPPLEGWIPPPPLDNEPFPPPPPPDEPFPPPPPEDAPETSHPMPLHFDSVQAFPYPQQYDMSYPGTGLAYYGQPNSEILGSTLYTIPEGGLVPNYFDASSNLYGMAVNQVEPITYYGSQNAIPSSVLAASAEVVESVGVNLEPTPQSLPSAIAGLVGSQVDYSSKTLLNTSHIDPKPCQGFVKPSLDAQTSVTAPEAASVINRSSISDASTSAVAATAPSTSKVPPKAARTKKRTVAVGSTLRSNKKVSSLVDKWKAAKEELDEEEEEPDPIEILERKRQREIEEWKAQQIASGEAKDNANFQPLGGDWRERVKRKRAERMKEAGQSSSTSAPDGIQQPPDLVELSKGLPSGWQAYWDESSKQVYYGNKLTSETSWDRPA